MVQKFQSPVRVYKYPFELVMKAYECRFPKCPQMPIVLDCEIIKDEIVENGSKRTTTRRCKLAVDAPYIFKKLIGVDVVYFIQTNYLDLANRTLNIEAVNESFSTRIEIFERCRYYTHPENPDWTCFDQIATLDVKSFFGFEHAMEKMGMKQYTQTTLKGKEIIEYFINELDKQGIAKVDRWISPNNSDTVELNHQENESGGVEKALKLESQSLMLDGEYIEQHLGTLTPMQESKLLELKCKLENISNLKKVPNYQIIMRFLIARDWNVEKAFHMLQESLTWRRENDIDNILNTYRVPSVIAKYFPGGWHHQDKNGRPVYILRLGHMDFKGILKSIGNDGLLKLSIYICEEGIRRINESSRKLKTPVNNWCVLIDLEGLSMRHLWRPGMKALYNVIKTVEVNYPETMGRVLVVRAPRVFPIAWTIVSAFIHENTRSKFLFYGGDDCLHMKDGLLQYIDSEFIPDFLGGSCKGLIHEGGVVPKSLYVQNSLEEEGRLSKPKDSQPFKCKSHNEHQNMYNTVELKASHIHEVIVRNTDPKSVLTWDFDVVRSDLHFTLYRTDIELPEKCDNGASYLDPNIFIEGKNYFRIEPTIMCHHNESVQGSHIMNCVGTYILQWFCPFESKRGTAQLNYFYEVLSSKDYKGSMTSLRSGCSSSSATSSCQSR